MCFYLFSPVACWFHAQHVYTATRYAGCPFVTVYLPGEKHGTPGWMDGWMDGSLLEEDDDDRDVIRAFKEKG